LNEERITVKNIQKIIYYVAIPALCLSLSGLANASSDEKGYVVDSQGDFVKDSYDECVRSASPGSKDAMGCGMVAEKPHYEPPITRTRAIMPPPAPKAVTTKTALEGKALFATNSFMLKPSGKASLDKLAAEIRSTPGVQEVHVIGYTDSTGSATHNQRLSEQRAITVTRYLDDQGVRNITAEGRGASDPVATNNTKEGRSQNRRVEIEVVTQ
jgi:outer membrane protein OmpA-like peptidoglycan-associated protein